MKEKQKDGPANAVAHFMSPKTGDVVYVIAKVDETKEQAVKRVRAEHFGGSKRGEQ
jgi:hypothetical protein